MILISLISRARKLHTGANRTQPRCPDPWFQNTHFQWEITFLAQSSKWNWFHNSKTQNWHKIRNYPIFCWFRFHGFWSRNIIGPSSRLLLFAFVSVKYWLKYLHSKCLNCYIWYRWHLMSPRSLCLIVILCVSCAASFNEVTKLLAHPLNPQFFTSILHKNSIVYFSKHCKFCRMSRLTLSKFWYA